MCPEAKKTILQALLICLVLGLAEAEQCSIPCRCPSKPPHCPSGTSLVLDGCGCCKVCARQLGDSCSSQKPCDHHRGLYCDYTSNMNRINGICLAREGATCDLGGVIYRTGESFQPSCKYQCTCMDGAIGCVPLCSDDMRLPSPDCPSPRRLKIPGKCCEEWICEDKAQENLFESAMAVYREIPAYDPDLNNVQDNCIVQTTEWSACSKTCGMGISIRVTNDNKECRLEKQSRLCMMRPCDLPLEKTIKKGKKCVRTPKPQKATRFEFSGCISVRSYKPKYCGVCTDGRCCTPHTTNTLEVEFKCPEGDVFKKKMMFIKTCSCHYDCPRDNDIFLATYYRRMTGDYAV